MYRYYKSYESEILKHTFLLFEISIGFLNDKVKGIIDVSELYCFIDLFNKGNKLLCNHVVNSQAE